MSGSTYVDAVEVPTDVHGLIFRMLPVKDLFSYVFGLQSLYEEKVGRSLRSFFLRFPFSAQIVCREWCQLIWKCQLSVELPFSIGKFQGLRKMSFLRCLTLRPPPKRWKIFSGVALLKPDNAQAGGDLVQLVPALGSSLQSLIIDESLADVRWRAFVATAFGCFNEVAPVGSLRLLTRLELDLKPTVTLDCVELPRGIVRTCPLLTRLKLLNVFHDWDKIFSILSDLEHLERLETSASANIHNWSSLRKLKNLRHLAVEDQDNFQIVIPRNTFHRIRNSDLFFVPLYSLQGDVLLFSTDYSLLLPLLDIYRKKGVPLSRATAVKVALFAAQSPVVASPAADPLWHPHLLAALHSDAPLTEDTYISVLNDIAAAGQKAAARALPLLFANFLHYGSSPFPAKSLPKPVSRALRSWVNLRQSPVALELVRLIPDLLTLSEMISLFVSFGNFKEARLILENGMANGQDVITQIQSSEKSELFEPLPSAFKPLAKTSMFGQSHSLLPQDLLVRTDRLAAPSRPGLRLFVASSGFDWCAGKDLQGATDTLKR